VIDLLSWEAGRKCQDEGIGISFGSIGFGDNQLSNFSAMKEAAVQAATKAAGQMAGQLTQDRVAALAQRLVTRLNEHVRSSGLDPFKGPDDRTVEFAVPLFCGFCPRVAA
uniref:Ketoacyl_synth_N domain-containing protein n=1 Tax=Macrostomum lignano TaxID=282301 RepID=A0A1I8GYE1_9PLAT